MYCRAGSGPKNCERLNILDVGAGTGLLGKRLTEWAGRRGWDWRFTNLDANPLALKIGNRPDSVVGSALQLPFADGSFDLVVASQMTHHLTDEQIVTHWREAWRVTRGGGVLLRPSPQRRALCHALVRTAFVADQSNLAQ